MRAIHVERFGGPETLELVDLPDPVADDGQFVVDVRAAGVNYADTHKIENGYLAPQQLPLVPGQEVVGITPEGQRVVALLNGGGYAQRASVHPAAAFEIPDEVSDGQALALVLQGVTAWHLLRTSAHLGAGESVAVFAAGGGVGSTAIQRARAWGAGRVVAASSSDRKRELALRLGADAVVDSTSPELTDALIEANEGRRIDVVLEMTGGAVFEQSLGALARFGRLVHYGTAGRAPAPDVSPGVLMQRSQAVVGFWAAHCKPPMLRAAMDDLLGMVSQGTLDPHIGGTYPLSEARRALEDLLGRRTTGKLVLDPAR